MTEPAALAELLDRHPLPAVDGDKRDRGTAVLVAGAPTCPGAAILTGLAALRAGAGRIQVVTHPDVATTIGVAVPEAFVAGWAPGAPPPEEVARRLRSADAVVVGPGLDEAAVEVALAVAGQVPAGVPLLLDARSVPAAAELRERCPLVLPNPIEARLLADDLGLDVGDEPVALVRALADALGAAAAVRGEETVVAEAAQVWRSTSGDPGLGTAGSGDVLVGVAGGLLARGLPAVAAVAWAVAVHATAGRLLGGGRPNPGYLARELLDAVPAAIDELAPR